ncbi:MAG: MarR family winged helix-turn-helix transcriptional regulator [Methylobacter sp.]
MNPSKLFDPIERMGALIRAEERKQCKELGLQAVHVQILDYLSICNKYSNTPSAISDYLGITRGPISQTLIHMDKKGLIEKYADVSNKRIVHVSITPYGMDILYQLKQKSMLKEASLIFKKNVSYSLEPFVQALTSLQKANNSKSFGVCKTCKYFCKTANGGVCGLTKENLSENNSEQICQEHLLQ